jgi:hypothetical protein
MTTITSFVNRLNKIGIKVTFISNYPWLYLDTVNGKKVKGTFLAEHGFTAFFFSVRPNEPDKLTDISAVFEKIRETLCKK